MEAVVPRHILYIVYQRCPGQEGLVSVDSVNGVFEGQLYGAVLLIFREDRTCNINIQHSKNILAKGKLRKVKNIHLFMKNQQVTDQENIYRFSPKNVSNDTK